MTTTNDQNLAKIGNNVMSALRDMVAALRVDYDRLEELREEREELADAVKDAADENNDQSAIETIAAHREANEALEQWDSENGDELRALESTAGDCTSEDDARERIQEDPLSLEFRSGWVSCKSDMVPEEYCLLLTTGGPAVRIIGEIDGDEASSARLQVQDWGTFWTEHIVTGDDHEVLMDYVRVFSMYTE